MSNDFGVSSNLTRAIVDNYSNIIKKDCIANAFFTTKLIYTPLDFKAISSERRLITDPKLIKMRIKAFLNTMILHGTNPPDVFNYITDCWNMEIPSYYIIKKQDIQDIVCNINHKELDEIVDCALLTIYEEKGYRVVICDFLNFDVF